MNQQQEEQEGQQDEPPFRIRYSALPSKSTDAQPEWTVYEAVHDKSGLPLSALVWSTLLTLYPETLGADWREVWHTFPKAAVFWECRASRPQDPFRFAVGPAPSLTTVQQADPQPFAKYFENSNHRRRHDHRSNANLWNELADMAVLDLDDDDDDDWDANSTGRVLPHGPATDADSFDWGSSTTCSDNVSDEGSVSSIPTSSLFRRPDENEDESSSSSSNDEDEGELELASKLPAATQLQDSSIAVTFWNLGKDAVLVAPRPSTPTNHVRYAHLGSYMQHASASEAVQLWAYVAKEYRQALLSNPETPIYFSTNGTGVSFLHFRLEHRPKYYVYLPFGTTTTHNDESTNQAMRIPTPSTVQVQVASDLHTEFYGLHTNVNPNIVTPVAPILALVGDIGNACTETLRDFLHAQADRFQHVLYIPGNHEFYNVQGAKRSIEEQRCWLQRVCNERENLHLMEESVFELEGVRILGTTLWSYIPDDMLQDSQRFLNDYHLSYNHEEGEAPRKLTAVETREWHLASRQWLQTELQRAQRDGIPTIVLTHHTPQLAGTSHPRYTGDPLGCCFSSDLTTELLSIGVHAWACGHTHYNFDKMVLPSVSGSGTPTRLLANQRGYKGSTVRDYRRDGGVIEIVPVIN